MGYFIFHYLEMLDFQFGCFIDKKEEGSNILKSVMNSNEK